MYFSRTIFTMYKWNVISFDYFVGFFLFIGEKYHFLIF